MRKLAAWSIDRQHDGDASQASTPKRVERSQIGLEKYLEDWIVNDVTLIGEGLTLVGRQIRIDDGIFDLLAIDSQDRWIVIEVKSGVLDSNALKQALYYASSMARLSTDELKGKLEPGLSELGDTAHLSERLSQQLAGEEEWREIAVMLVGAGIHSGLERMNEFLGRFAVPISEVASQTLADVSGQGWQALAQMRLGGTVADCSAVSSNQSAIRSRNLNRRLIYDRRASDSAMACNTAVTEFEPEILSGGPELLVRLQLQTRDILTIQDGEIRRTVASPHPDSSHLAMSLSDFRTLATEIEDLAMGL